MFRSNRRCRLLSALALAALVAGLGAPAHARPASRQGGVGEGWAPLASLWTAVSRLWTGEVSGLAGSAAGRGLRHLTGAEGASLDPHGGTSNTGSGTGTGSPAPQGNGSL